MKIDPYKQKERYLKWKEGVKKGIPGISKTNSDIISMYITDMENGLNVANASQKGARSYIRLNNIRQRLIFLTKHFEICYNMPDIVKITENQLFKFFNEMRNGKLTKIELILEQIQKSILKAKNHN